MIAATNMKANMPSTRAEIWFIALALPITCETYVTPTICSSCHPTAMTPRPEARSGRTGSGRGVPHHHAEDDGRDADRDPDAHPLEECSHVETERVQVRQTMLLRETVVNSSTVLPPRQSTTRLRKRPEERVEATVAGKSAHATFEGALGGRPQAQPP